MYSITEIQSKIFGDINIKFYWCGSYCTGWALQHDGVAKSPLEIQQTFNLPEETKLAIMEEANDVFYTNSTSTRNNKTPNTKIPNINNKLATF